MEVEQGRQEGELEVAPSKNNPTPFGGQGNE